MTERRMERSDYCAHGASMWTGLIPEMPKSPEMAAAEFMMSAQGRFEENYGYEEQGRVVALLSAWDPMAEAEVQRVLADVLAVPDASDDALHATMDRAFEVAQRTGAKTLTVSAISRTERLVRLCEDRGGELTQSLPASRLDMTLPIPTDLQNKADEAIRSGVEIVTAVDLDARGIDWLPKHYEASQEMLDDLPGPHLRARPSFEAFQAMFEDHKVYPRDSLFFALDGAQFVGYSRLTPLDMRADTAMTGLSGVVRSHRRRGVVTAIKVETIRRLSARGLRWLITDNDATNPMYALNLAFGFQPIFCWLCYDWPREAFG